MNAALPTAAPVRRSIALPKTRAGGRCLRIGRYLSVVLLAPWLHTPTLAAASDQSLAATNRIHEAVAAELGKAASAAIEDIAIAEDGTIRGRVRLGATSERPTDLCVKFVRGGRAVAVAAIDRDGRFTARNLSAGLYRVVVEGTERSDWRYFRLWYAEAAPPLARPEILSLSAEPLAEPIVRGQRPVLFPIMSLRQAAAVTGIVGGAIAAPLIYQNARDNNRVPASR